MSDAYEELYVYAMGRDPASFILQHIVDANAAQTATVNTKPITIVFGLIGLCLRVEKHFSGRQVQQAQCNWDQISGNGRTSASLTIAAW